MEMLPEEKGIYIDLLAHQHQKKNLPADTKRLAKLANVSHAEFISVWEATLKHKFKQDGDRLVNRKLSEIVSERLSRGWRNKIIGTLGSIIRLSGLPQEVTLRARKTFRVEDFVNVESECLSERLSEWFHKRLKSIEDEDANANANNINKGVVVEKRGSLTFEMVQIFKESYPNYPVDLQKDYSSCVEIAVKIGELKNWTKESLTNGKMPYVLDAWKSIVQFSCTDEWFSTRSITDFGKEFQRLIQKMSNGTKSSAVKSGKRSSGASILREQINQSIASGRKTDDSPEI